MRDKAVFFDDLASVNNKHLTSHHNKAAHYTAI